eukprot:gnl/TRDRNA2_/TRDRNA2_178704_c0_seq1.p1 gnl/TRDRNA2_/TRDRNA2_178704_c0~~gnl/TRDRNA2_/TRDRNA2_178704_c0_seq1.p1  ORF type:complete len:620 (-),score=125.42 gnl/TRDRNA2_/TRDRNA2_178704_c0_seq1:174-2033(-)
MAGYVSLPREALKPQAYASDGADAIGFLQFWGNSPALDLVEDSQASAYGPAAVATSNAQVGACQRLGPQPTAEDITDEIGDGDAETENIKEADAPPAPDTLPDDGHVNILVAGGCDIRHVLKTVARRRRHPAGTRLRFFLHDVQAEVVARHILFLQIINNTSLPIRERMETFLSLYGNTLIREKDSLYVSKLVTELVDFVTDNSENPLNGLIDLSHLKFKERDELMDVIKGWSQDVQFDIEALRDQRLRGYYRDRYDYRKNLMDHDYTNHIKHVAGIINWYHYKEFCHTGLAFEARLGPYDTPNRTLASYTEGKCRTKGTTIQVRGFWGDIINSPYHGFSTTTDPKDYPRLFKVGGSQYRNTESDVAEFNVLAYLSELETGEPYHLPPEVPEESVFPYQSPLEELRKPGGLMSEVTEAVEVKEEQKSEGAKEAARPRNSRKATKKAADFTPLLTAFNDIDIVLLAGDLREVLNKSKYKGLFHRAFMGTLAALPLLEDTGIAAGEDPGGKTEAARRYRQPPRYEAPEAFGEKRGESPLAAAMREGGQVTFETMKYQAHFDGRMKIGYRHKVAQAAHLVGWRALDEKRAIPRLEADAKDRRLLELEKDSTDFLRFVVCKHQ